VSEPERVVRRAARVVLVDERERVLLVHGRDPGRPDLPSWWILPGGGLDEGESPEAAARREVLEETGLRLGELGAVVLSRAVTFEFDGLLVEQDEVLFLARIDSKDAVLDTSGWNAIEQRALTELRWWTTAELDTTTETVYPEQLLDLLRDNGIG
jgi:8-oxo-dGTP pyrophosphatase MutT (NUDIX family)